MDEFAHPSILRRKRRGMEPQEIANRSYRHKVTEELREIICAQDIENTNNIEDVHRKDWKKVPDSPIVVTLASEFNQDKQWWDYKPASNLQSEALKRLKKSHNV